MAQHGILRSVTWEYRWDFGIQDAFWGEAGRSKKNPCSPEVSLSSLKIVLDAGKRPGLAVRR